MMSESCSNATLRRCIFCQIEYGDFSRPATSITVTPASSQTRRNSCRTSSITSAPWPRRKLSRAWMVSSLRARAARRRAFCSSVLHRVHADALGERRVDLHRLAGDALAPLGIAHEMQRAHVVQAIGELDQQHADVAADRQDELAEILRLLGAVRLQLQPGELGDAVDQRRRSRARTAARCRPA